MGLLDGFLSLDEHQRQAMLAAAAAMLQNKGNTAQGIGAGIGGGLLGYNTSKGLGDRRAEEAQQRQMRELQIEEAKRAQAARAGMQGAFGQAFGANPSLVTNDDEGNPMPQAPGGGGMPEFLKLAGPYMDPMQAAQMMQPKQPKYHVVAGALVPEPQNGGPATPVYQAPEKPDGPKKGQVREVKSGGNVFTYEWNGEKWEKIAVAPQFKPDGPEKPEKPPQGYRWVADGKLEPIAGGPADPKGGKPTDTERVAAGYHDRMLEAEKIMSKVGDDKGKPGVREAMMTKLPGGETIANAMPALMGGRSSERQQYRQAQEDWVRAKLRKESGAVIADQEMDREIRTYFPQIGDGPEVLKQKAAARQTAIRAMKTGAGPVVQDSVDDLLRKYGVR